MSELNGRLSARGLFVEAQAWPRPKLLFRERAPSTGTWTCSVRCSTGRGRTPCRPLLLARLQTSEVWGH